MGPFLLDFPLLTIINAFSHCVIRNYVVSVTLPFKITEKIEKARKAQMG